jgi:5-methylcytosine-specific restriction protein A
MAKAQRVCSTPGCPELTPGGRCTGCKARAEQERGSASSRGYGSRWARVIRPRFLRRHPLCVLCGAPATDPDHWPIDRRTLVADGCPDPDADERMRALCSACHKRATAEAQPGGWNARE